MLHFHSSKLLKFCRPSVLERKRREKGSSEILNETPLSPSFITVTLRQRRKREKRRDQRRRKKKPRITKKKHDREGLPIRARGKRGRRKGEDRRTGIHSGLSIKVTRGGKKKRKRGGLLLFLYLFYLPTRLRKRGGKREGEKRGKGKGRPRSSSFLAFSEGPWERRRGRGGGGGERRLGSVVEGKKEKEREWILKRFPYLPFCLEKRREEEKKGNENEAPYLSKATRFHARKGRGRGGRGKEHPYRHEQ